MYKYNKYLSSLLLILISSLFCVADEARINLEYKGQHDHFVHTPLTPADQPAVYYDDLNQQIIIDGTGEASYYNVEITSLSTFYVMISTSVNGNYDTIDVASLPDDNYEIVITSSLNNVFEGYFTM